MTDDSELDSRPRHPPEVAAHRIRDVLVAAALHVDGLRMRLVHRPKQGLRGGIKAFATSSPHLFVARVRQSGTDPRQSRSRRQDARLQWQRAEAKRRWRRRPSQCHRPRHVTGTWP